MKCLICLAIFVLASPALGQSGTCPAPEIVEVRMEASAAAEESVRETFARALGDSSISDGSLSEMETYERIVGASNITATPEGFERFQAAVDEIASAAFRACVVLTIGAEDIPRLTASLTSLLDAGNVTEARDVYGQLLCLLSTLSGSDESRKKRQSDPIDDLNAFFDSLDGERLMTIFGINIFDPTAPVTLAFVVDDTGSMAAEISSVQRLIRSFVATERTDPVAYILTTFNDPAVGVPMRYDSSSLTELTALEAAVSAIFAHGGGDCPELGMTGILNALSLAEPDSNVIVLTDAAPKDFHLQSDVIAEATTLRNSIHFFLARSGCGDFSPYIEVANATFGVIVNTITDFEAFSEFADRVSGRFTMSTGGRRRRETEMCISVPVSIFATSVDILFTGVTDSIEVTSPSGAVETFAFFGSIVTFSTDSPEPGVYTACSNGTFSYSASVDNSLDTAIDFVDTGSDTTVIVTSSRLDDLTVGDDSKPLILSIVLEDGTVWDSTVLLSCGGVLSGTLPTLPSVPFRCRLEGCDEDGNRFSITSELKRVPPPPTVIPPTTEPPCPCLNGGSCVTFIRFGIPTVRCECPAGLSGSFCELLLGASVNVLPETLEGREEDGYVDITVTLSGPSANDVEFTLTFTDGTATGGDDYDSTTIVVIIAAGETSVTVRVIIYKDCENEGLERFQVTITARVILEDGTPGASISVGIIIIIIIDYPGRVCGDPHFMVPLMSHENLCYSVQGYPGLAFNLISNKDYVINAMFIDSIGDTTEATWIGKMAVLPRNNELAKGVVFDSVNQEVSIINEGTFKADIIEQIVFSNETSKVTVKFSKGLQKKAGNPVIHVVYQKPYASFDVTFFSNHLNVDWDIKYESSPLLHGLMGQFMTEGVDIDPVKQMLIVADRSDPVPVVKEGNCWKAKNPGHQGEGLIQGNILNYYVKNIIDADFTFTMDK